MGMLADALAGQRLFVEIPGGGVAEWVAACEVMTQEGLAAWTFAVADLPLVVDALALFGRRARIGVRDVRSPADLEAAARAGAHFVTSPVYDGPMIHAARGRPFIAGALTPAEIHAAFALGAPAVQVLPADVLGMSYSRVLAGLFPGRELVATGKLERFQIEMWLQACAGAVGLAGTVLLPEDVAPASHPRGTPLTSTNDLDEVRRRCQWLANLNAGEPRN